MVGGGLTRSVGGDQKSVKTGQLLEGITQGFGRDFGGFGGGF